MEWIDQKENVNKEKETFSDLSEQSSGFGPESGIFHERLCGSTIEASTVIPAPIGLEKEANSDIPFIERSANVDILTARAMDMVEADIRKTQGNSAFRQHDQSAYQPGRGFYLRHFSFGYPPCLT